MTAIDWETRLKRRAAAVERAKRALEEEITDAHDAGLGWRKIGTAAGVNHERARQIGERITRERTGET